MSLGKILGRLVGRAVKESVFRRAEEWLESLLAKNAHKLGEGAAELFSHEARALGQRWELVVVARKKG